VYFIIVRLGDDSIKSHGAASVKQILLFYKNSSARLILQGLHAKPNARTDLRQMPSLHHNAASLSAPSLIAVALHG
jgi:hypothetical protein